MDILGILILIILMLIIFYAISYLGYILRGGRGRTQYYRDSKNGRHLYFTLDRDIDKCYVVPSDLLSKEIDPDKLDIAQTLKTKYIKSVGKGGYGIVYAGLRVGKFANLPIAGKTLMPRNNYKRELKNSAIIMNKMKELSKNKTYDEINALANDYRICAIYDIQENDGKATIRMQYAGGGTLRDFINTIKNMKKIPDDYIVLEKIITFNIIWSVFILHRMIKLIHLDIKPENIVFIEDPLKETDPVKRCLKAANLRLIDFGMAEQLTDKQKFITARGTLEYMAPEMTTSGVIPLSPKYDTWSIGCIIWNLLTLDELLVIHSMKDAAYNHAIIKRYPKVFINSLLKNIHDSDLKMLIESALNPSIDVRVNVGELLNYKWFDDIPLVTVPNSAYFIENVRRLDLDIDETHKHIEEHMVKNNDNTSVVMEERLSPIQSPIMVKHYLSKN